jgi:hypothetical protein
MESAVHTDFYHRIFGYIHPIHHSQENLAGDGVHGSRRLLHSGGEAGDHEVHDDRQKGREEGGETVVETTILLDADDLVDRPADKVKPRDGSREGETRDDRVEGLGLEFLGEYLDSFDGGAGHLL